MSDAKIFRKKVLMEGVGAHWALWIERGKSPRYGAS